MTKYLSGSNYLLSDWAIPYIYCGMVSVQLEIKQASHFTSD